MRRDLRRSIRKSAGRYLAILAIIALGSGFLVGLRSTKGGYDGHCPDLHRQTGPL